MALDHGRRYDAFLSYASADRRRARRVQRYLERWKDPRSGRRLAVYFDETDIRGGKLDEELRRAAHEAHTLIVCVTPSAMDSLWVAAEIGLFREKAQPDRIAALILGGDAEPARVGSELVPGAVVRAQDLRRGWWLAWLGLGIEVELLRLLAFVADVDLRTLRNWHLRRTLLHVAFVVLAVLVPLGFVAHWPLDDWERLVVQRGGQPVYAIAAEADGTHLRVVHRFRGAGPQGFRNYLETIDDALAPNSPARFHEVPLSARLLPVSLVPVDLRNRIPALDVASVTQRKLVANREPLVGEPVPGKLVVVLAVAPSEDEDQDARDQSADMGTPIPTVAGAVVATIDSETTRIAEVLGLDPLWKEFDETRTPTSPSRAIAVAWAPEGDVWLGLGGESAQQRGGLWHRAAGAAVWERDVAFSSVRSIALDVRDGTTRAITVAEGHLDVWHGIVLEPHPARVVTRAVGEAQWRAAIAPPYGTRSEVELAGQLRGEMVIRVDEQLFRHRRLALWRFLRGG